MSAKRILLLTCMALASLWLSGCGGKKAEEDVEYVNPEEQRSHEPGAPATSDRPIKVALIPRLLTGSFAASMRVGAIRAQQKLDKVFLSWSGPTKADDVSGQTRIMHDYIWQGIDAMVIHPLDVKALGPSLGHAKGQNIPVAAVNLPLQGANVVSCVTCSDTSVGALAADHLAQLLDGKGEVLVLREQKESVAANDIAKGFSEALAIKHTDLTSVEKEAYAGKDPAAAHKAAAALLKKHPKLAGVYCSGTIGAEAVLKALQEAKRAGQVKFVVSTTSPALVKALTDGQLHAMALPNAAQLGYRGVEAVVNQVRGRPVQIETIVDPMLVTKANMGQQEMKDLHSPDPLSLLPKKDD